MANLTAGWSSLAKNFWRVEVPPGKPILCHPGSKYYLHISQASLGDKDLGDEARVVLRAKAGDYEAVIGTLTQGQCDQMLLNLIFNDDFLLYHNNNICSVYFYGYRIKATTEDYLNGSREDEIEEKKANIGVVSPETKVDDHSGATFIYKKVQPYVLQEKMCLARKLEEDAVNIDKDADEDGEDGDCHDKKFEKRKNLTSELEATPARKKIKLTPIIGNQSHKDFWESLIVAGRSDKKGIGSTLSESVVVRPLQAKPMCSSEDQHKAGAITERVADAKENLYDCEKKIGQALCLDSPEKDKMPVSENGATLVQPKFVFHNCAVCSRNFATAFALKQHCAVKHQ